MPHALESNSRKACLRAQSFIQQVSNTSVAHRSCIYKHCYEGDRSSAPVRVGREGAYAVAPVQLGRRGTWHFIPQDVDTLARVGSYGIAVIRLGDVEMTSQGHFMHRFIVVDFVDGIMVGELIHQVVVHQNCLCDVIGTID